EKLFFQAISYEMTMEIQHKKSGGKDLGVIIRGNDADNMFDNMDISDIADSWGKSKSATVIIDLENEFTMELINRDSRVNSLATVGHGNPGGILTQSGVSEYNYSGITPSKTIKKVYMMNCHSAFLPGLESAFPE